MRTVPDNKQTKTASCSKVIQVLSIYLHQFVSMTSYTGLARMAKLSDTSRANSFLVCIGKERPSMEACALRSSKTNQEGTSYIDRTNQMKYADQNTCTCPTFWGHLGFGSPLRGSPFKNNASFPAAAVCFLT